MQKYLNTKEHSNQWFDAREWDSFTIEQKRAWIVFYSFQYLASADEIWEEVNPLACRELPGNPHDASGDVLADRGKPLHLYGDEFLEALRK